MTERIGLRFGALTPKISEQLNESGIAKSDLKRFDGHAEAITRLHICGLLTDSESRKARQRLMNVVAKKYNCDNNCDKLSGKQVKP